MSVSGSSLCRAEVDVARASDRPPPVIQLGPVNQTLPIGSMASLPCQATSQDTKITWLKDGVPLSTLHEDRVNLDEDNTLSIKGNSPLFVFLVLYAFFVLYNLQKGVLVRRSDLYPIKFTYHFS